MRGIDRIRRRVDRLRRPAYTGSNRCWPCTALNLALVAAVGLMVAPLSPIVAALTVVGGVGAVALRGYVIPYTPRFAPAIADRLPWNPFHGDERGLVDDRRVSAGIASPVADGDVSEPIEDGERVLDALVASGVVESDGDELALTPAFDERWRREIDRLRERSDEELADVALAVSPAKAVETVRGDGRSYVVLSDGSDDPAGESWLRRPVALAGVGAARALAAFDVPPEIRPTASDALAIFVETCPACENPLEEMLPSECCGSGRAPLGTRPDPVLACRRCGVHFAEL